MPPVYWIEDEDDLLGGAKDLIEEQVGIVTFQKHGEDVLALLDRIRGDPGPVLLDLWLPEITDGETLRGPRTGMWVLAKLQERLGRDWPIFIVSGNLSLEAMEKIIHERGIPMSRVFTKPLNDQIDTLIEELKKVDLPGQKKGGAKDAP